NNFESAPESILNKVPPDTPRNRSSHLHKNREQTAWLRARLRIGGRGDIGVARHGKSSWLARCAYRDSRGKRRKLTTVARTKSAAITALRGKWHDVSSRIIAGTTIWRISQWSSW